MTDTLADLLVELGINSPWMNVPGFLGYLPPARTDYPFELGAFLPPPLSIIARNPASKRAALPFEGGVLMRTGLPNPGIAAAIRQYRQRWERLTLPVWLSLLPRDANEAREMSEQVDELECAATFQLLLPRNASTRDRLEILSAAQGEKPFFVELPLDEVNREFVAAIQKSSAVGVVISAPRGALPQGEDWVGGRLYGPALYPLAARVVKDLVKEKLTVVAGCGVSTLTAAESMLSLGAIAAQFDTAFWD
jgi:Dihydroorotate dehydrogenase